MSSVSFTRTTSSQSDKDALADDYDKLGITPDLADHIVSRVYDQQVQRDAPRTGVMLDALIRIAQSRGSSALEEKVAIERSLDRHPASEIVNAYKELQLDNPFLNYVSEDQITMAFDARNSAVEHRERRRVLFEAAKVVAAHSQSDVLKAMLESMNEEIVRVAAPSGHAAVKPKMSLDAAYRALGFEPGVDLDESTISMLYTIRVRPRSPFGHSCVAAGADGSPLALSFARSSTTPRATRRRPRCARRSRSSPTTRRARSCTPSPRRASAPSTARRAGRPVLRSTSTCPSA